MNFPLTRLVKASRSLSSRQIIDCCCRRRSWNNRPTTSLSSRARGGDDAGGERDQEIVDQGRLRWREDWSEESKSYFKMLRSFYSESSNVEMKKFLQSDIDLSPSAIKKWFSKKREAKEVILQSYIEERNRILGNELAAAHFVVFRGGAVKFHNESGWIKADKNGDYSLPDRFVSGKYLEAIDCSDMTLHYEGLANFRNLRNLNWLSLNGCVNIDDWCMDEVSGSLGDSLIYLDIRNCPNITERGLVALWKLENLKLLYLDDVLRSSDYEMTVLLLQEHLPRLEIKVGDHE